MDYRLLQRRHRWTDKGIEAWMVRVYSPDDPTITLLSVTNAPQDIEYDGDLYTSYNLTWSMEDQGADVGLPLCRLTISNILRALQSATYASDFYRGCEAEVFLFNTEEPSLDYTDEIKNFLIVNHEVDLYDLTFTLGASHKIADYIPQDVYIPYSCRHQFPNYANGFTGARCGYTGVSVGGVTLSGANPVRITANGHGLTSGDAAFVRNIANITPSLDGPYIVTVVDINTFTLDDTVSSDYSGIYSGGGRAGHEECSRYKEACRIRGRIARFGATPNLRYDGLRVGV